jgi:hypothetical protein
MPDEEEDDEEEECESLDGDDEEEEEDEEEDEEDEEEDEEGIRQCAEGSSANNCAIVVGGNISRGKSTRCNSSSGARVSRS